MRKADGGVRPVAVGETLRRLTGKVLLATAVAKAQISHLTPVQVGVGVPSAAESVVMGTQWMGEWMGWPTPRTGYC